MGQPGVRASRWVAACVLAFSFACGSGSTPPAEAPLGPPVPVGPGLLLGTSSALKIGPAGGTVTASSDGTATVSVPAGALATEVDLTVEVITNTAPSAVGNAYRVAVVPADTALAAPVALVFTPPPGSPSLETLTLARQDENGYWVRQQGVTRDPLAGTLTVTTTRLGDWAIVGAPNGRDLIGVFDVASVSTAGATITASGKSSLNFHWGDPATGDLGWYIQSGHVTAQPPITRAGQTCTPAALTMRLAPNVASLLANPTRFRWAVDGRWEMTCGSSPDLALGLLAFDTSGIGHLGCARRDLDPPITTAERLQGRSEIDCGAGGTVTASWRFEICNEGQPCAPSSACHTASVTCDTGLPLCVDDGNLPNGTSCDVDPAQPEVCGDGVCNVCRAGEGCDPAGSFCHVGAYTCDTGFEVCTDTGAFKTNGTRCSVAATDDGVCGSGTCNLCAEGAACTPSVCNTGNVQCDTGFPVCTDTGDVPNGTGCDVDPAVAEVCFNGACSACSAGLACSTNPNSCVAGVTDCSTGQERCVDTTTSIPNGSACDVTPVPEVCFNGACNACTAGTSCSTNPNECVQGVTSCATGQEVCVDTTTAIPNGTTCGADMVCNGGLCSACTANVACPGNPNVCFAGTTSCATGVETCVDVTSAPTDAGTACGDNQVCDGTGACVACTAGLGCTTNSNPCVAGTTSCASGGETCEDTAAPIAAGTACDVNPAVAEVCDGAGACVACTAGQLCTSNLDACLTGITSCATGAETCLDNAAAPEPNGTACGTNQVCNGGACSACTAGEACATNPNPCVLGTTSCATGVATCVDTTTAKGNGTACGTDLVCSGGVCTSCFAGLPCSENPDPCKGGITSCATGSQVCVDDPAAPEPNGLACAPDAVCNGGACSTCVAGGTCSTNPDRCVEGILSCASGTQECVDGATPLATGASCGTDQVCDAAGTCVACVAGAACTENPDPCRTGVTSCATGTQTCVDTATAEPNGLACDVNPLVGEVCNGGVCSECTAGVACEGNPNQCVFGITSCATGAATCVDGPTPDLAQNGQACGVDAVCNAGLCSGCVAGAACDTNSNVCVAGVTSCSTGVQTCEDTTTAIRTGEVCDVDGAVPEVCNGGTCSACTAGLACSDNPNSCVLGTTSCATGTSTCVDTATPRPAGTSCGDGQVCSGSGVCNACVAGLDCTAAGACTQSFTSCSTGTQICVETGVPLANGTSCGTDLVCASGVCGPCSAGDACSTNPNACVAGVTSCATGVETCVDTAALLQDGTVCGTNAVCSAGVCGPCTAGLACDGNPDPCRSGITSCSTGTQTCVDGANFEPNGTVCGADLVCSAGACVSCVAGAACSTNPTACLAGTTSCATGTQSCVDTATPLPNGTTCGVGQVCSAGACLACTAGVTCDTNPNACAQGVTDCGTGTSVCVDSGALEPSGTSCGTNLVCSAGTCTSCVADVDCTPASSCTTWKTSCATGTSVCADTGVPVPNGTVCGTDQVCSGGSCTACSSGAACTNPGSCLAGTTTCSTGTSTCLDTATPLANGTTCGTDQVCNAGACVPCVADATCSSNPDPLCHDGVTSCATGAETCLDAAAKADGTSCGTDLVCSGGACVTCVANALCSIEGSCFEGRTSCATGTSVCEPTATPLVEGTSCGASSLCQSGACVSVRSVTGSRLATYWTTTGTCTAAAPCKSTVVATDVLLSPYATVSAHPVAGGTWEAIPGTFTGDGSFSIPNVPAGPYQLVLVDGRGVVHVVETDSSDVDLGYDVLGRADAELATSPALVSFDLTGLTPWLAEDEVEATAFDVDVFDVPVSGADVGTGQTTGGVVEDWGASSVGHALNALTGTDVLHLHQLSTETATDGVTAYAYQRATVAAATLDVATPAPIAAALAPVIDTGTVTVSWQPEAFETLLAALGPSPTPLPNPHRLLVETAPYASLAAAPVAANGTPQLFRMARPHGGAEALAPISLAPITYGRFLDVGLASEWRRADFAATVGYSVSGAAQLDVVTSIGRRDSMGSPPPTPITPVVGPVSSPLVAGANALGTIPATGLTPTLSWSAPAIGTPTRYEVRVHALEAQGTATVARTIATFRLTGTSVQVPEALLASNGTYFAEITAYVVPGDGFAAAPLRRGQVFSHATTLTSPFSP